MRKARPPGSYFCRFLYPEMYYIGIKKESFNITTLLYGEENFSNGGVFLTQLVSAPFPAPKSTLIK